MDVLRTIMDEIEHVVANVKKDEIDQVIGGSSWREKDVPDSARKDLR